MFRVRIDDVERRTRETVRLPELEPLKSCLEARAASAAPGLYELSQGRARLASAASPGGLGCRDRPLLANSDMSAGTG
jgi:hypothetical protein